MNSPQVSLDKVKHSKETQANISLDVSSSDAQEKSQIFVMKIEVDYGLAPGQDVPIWRIVEVPSTYSFYDLHVAIQDLMGWMDYHLHKFSMFNPAKNRREHIGIPDKWLSKSIVPEKTALIANYFSPSNEGCKYVYDFGSTWNFRITLKKTIPVDPNIKYPRCVAAMCSSPDEDHPEDTSFIDIPFDYQNIKFRDPVEAWEDAFQGF